MKNDKTKMKTKRSRCVPEFTRDRILGSGNNELGGGFVGEWRREPRGGSWDFRELRSRASERLICRESTIYACAERTILFPRLRPRHEARLGRETECINAQSHRNVSRLPRTRNKQTRCLEETASRQGKPRAWNTFERVLAHGKANDGPNESDCL